MEFTGLIFFTSNSTPTKLCKTLRSFPVRRLCSKCIPVNRPYKVNNLRDVTIRNYCLRQEIPTRRHR
jgi:hypothetical protein